MVSKALLTTMKTWAIHAWEQRTLRPNLKGVPAREPADGFTLLDTATRMPEQMTTHSTGAFPASPVPAIEALNPNPASWRGLPVVVFDSCVEVPALRVRGLRQLSSEETQQAWRAAVEPRVAAICPGISLAQEERVAAFRAAAAPSSHEDQVLLMRLLHPRSQFAAYHDEATGEILLMEAMGPWPEGVGPPQPAEALRLLEEELVLPDSPLPREILVALAETLPLSAFELLKKAGWCIGGPRKGIDSVLWNLFGPLSHAFIEMTEPDGMRSGHTNPVERTIRLHHLEQLNVAVYILTHEIAHVVSILLGPNHSMAEEPAWREEHERALASDPAAGDAARASWPDPDAPQHAGLIEKFTSSLNLPVPPGTSFLTLGSTRDAEEHLVETSALLFQSTFRCLDAGFELTPAVATSANLALEAPKAYAHVVDVWARRVKDALADPELARRQPTPQQALEADLARLGRSEVSWAWLAFLGVIERDEALVLEGFTGMSLTLKERCLPEKYEERSAELRKQLDDTLAWIEQGCPPPGSLQTT
jgi:hypothetical protein